MALILESTIVCPRCGHAASEQMPSNACTWFYQCPGCAELLRPKPGDCCVYCSYGDVPCPPKQVGDDCCK